MEITQHYNGIRGDWIEFQITHKRNPHLKDLKHWQKDSLFLRATEDVPYQIFDELLGEGWWIGFNQLNSTNAINLANKLEDIDKIEKLTHWIITHVKEDNYLNVLGV